MLPLPLAAPKGRALALLTSRVFPLLYDSIGQVFSWTEDLMASAVWKGTISFGLVSIPIRMYAAARAKRANLHQIHKVCNTRIKQPLFCPGDLSEKN